MFCIQFEGLLHFSILNDPRILWQNCQSADILANSGSVNQQQNLRNEEEDLVSSQKNKQAIIKVEKNPSTESDFISDP